MEQIAAATRAQVRHRQGLALIRAYLAEHPTVTLEDSPGLPWSARIWPSTPTATPEEAHAAVVRQSQEQEKQS